MHGHDLSHTEAATEEHCCDVCWKDSGEHGCHELFFLIILMMLKVEQMRTPTQLTHFASAPLSIIV